MNHVNRTPYAAQKLAVPVDRMESDIEESNPRSLDTTLL